MPRFVREFELSTGTGSTAPFKTHLDVTNKGLVLS